MSLRTIPETEEGVFKATASGTLPNGKPVIVNSDGTVGVVASTSFSNTTGSEQAFDGSIDFSSLGVVNIPDSNTIVIAYRDQGDSGKGKAIVGTVSGTSISFETPVVFEPSSFTSAISAAYDTSSGNVVIAYRDVGNSEYGTAVVGSVAGTSISFGTPVVFQSSSTDFTAVAADSGQSKVVVAFRANTFGNAIVGTVSGTSISFGSAAVFESTTNDAQYIAATFNVVSGKTVICYTGTGSGDVGQAVVGTVSGTSISFGSKATFNSNASTDTTVSSIPNTTTVVISYSNSGNTSRPESKLATISGTSLSFGSAAIVDSTTSAEYISSAYDPVGEQIVVFYKAINDSSKGQYVRGTVSGTSITYGSETDYNAGATGRSFAAHVSDTSSVVVAYSDDGATSGSAVVVQNAASIPNLTAENFIGLSSGGSVPNAGNARVDIIGTLNNELSGLNPGQKYFVQSDGSLSTTADTPEVFAGTAISATSLLVKL
jgi:hypothetical protein